jgi:signal transduction histidine kinase
MLRKEEPTRQAVDLNALVEDSMRLLRSDLLGRHVRAQPDLEAGLPPVVGDRNQLQQVLLNLVLNACDAMDGQATDRRLTVRTRQRDQGRVEVSVSDHGPGIPEADLDRLFDPFVTTKAQGLGLGLTICRSIVEAHGGRLWATNPGQGGATLHCELPATPG